MAHKKVYLIRHGKTLGNAEKRYVGRRTDEELSEEGIKDTNEMFGSISKLIADRVDRVCSSPMKRAVQTAEILFGDYVPETIDNLVEIDFGVFEGKNYEELNGDEIYQKWIDWDTMCKFNVLPDEIIKDPSFRKYINFEYLKDNIKKYNIRRFTI